MTSKPTIFSLKKINIFWNQERKYCISVNFLPAILGFISIFNPHQIQNKAENTTGRHCSTVQMQGKLKIY